MDRSQLREYIAAVLEAYLGVSDEDANQEMTLILTVRDLRIIAALLEHG
jgi:hypothetical protein